MAQALTFPYTKDTKSITAVLFFVKNGKDLNKYNLSKLLYYADAIHFQKYGHSITGREYIHIERSPIPEGMNELLTDMVQHKLMVVKPAIKNGQVNGMVFESIVPVSMKAFSLKEAKSLKLVNFLIGKKIGEESQVFPRLYEHYIITDLFTRIDFSKLPKERAPKISNKRKLVSLGDKIYKILFENH